MPIQSTSGSKLTYEDYARIPADGRRHEIIGGEHIVSPAPHDAHQIVLLNLSLGFERLRESGRASVVFEAVDVHLSDFDIVQPAVIVVAAHRAKQLSELKLDGPPDLAVEILSPLTKYLDLGKKLALYQKAGVAEYWVLDPVTRTLRQFVRTGGGYVTNIYCDVTVASTAFPGFELDLATLWNAEAPRELDVGVPFGDST